MAERQIIRIIQVTGAAIALVSVLFIFGLAGSVELNKTSIAESIPQFLTFMGVAIFGALLTKIRKDIDE